MEFRLVADGHLKVNRNGTVIRTKNGKEAAVSYTSRNKNYALTTWCQNGKQRHEYIHRLVCSAFHPNPMNYPEINHIDGNPRNNHADNLEWCTREQNIRHAFDNGLVPTTTCKKCGVEKFVKRDDYICSKCKQIVQDRENKKQTRKKKAASVEGVALHCINQNEARAVELRARGMTYQEIGDVMGFSRQRAEQLIKRSLLKSQSRKRKSRRT